MINKKIILFSLIIAILLLNIFPVYAQVEKEKKEIEKRESKVEKYYFIPITFFSAILITVFWLITKKRPEKRPLIKMSNNILMLLLFLFVSLSGIALIFGYKIQGFDLKFWHVIFSEFLVYAIIFHIIIHWSTWLSYFKKIIEK
jgi:uncharacterized membrane protein